MSAIIATMKSIAIVVETSKLRKAPTKRTLMRVQMSSAHVVHRLMAQFATRARRERISSSHCILRAAKFSDLRPAKVGLKRGFEHPELKPEDDRPETD
jgi:hypothetical protein